MADTVDPDPPPPPPEEVPPTAVAVTQPITPIPPDAPPPRQGCMAKRSCLEKALLFLIIIIVIICIIAVAAFLVYYFFQTPPEGTCLTDSCVNAASRLKKSMNEKENPCEDFYEYACGGWDKSNMLEATEDRLDTFTTIQDNFKVKMKRLLSQAIEDDDPKYSSQPREFYKSCMDLDRIEDRGTKPFMEFLETIGKFPTLDSTWNETDYDLTKLVGGLAQLGVTPLFSITVDRDVKKPDKNRIYLGDAVLGLGSQTAYKGGRKDPGMKLYEKWMMDALVMLGANKKTAKEDVGDVLDLEIRLSELMRDPVEKEDRSKKLNEEQVTVIRADYSWIDWLDVFNGILTGTRDTRVKENDLVINQEKEYMGKLEELLKDTDKRVMTNFMMSHLLKFTYWLGKDFRTIRDQFVKVYSDIEDKPSMERWERCIQQATAIYPDAVSRMYVDEHFPKEAKEGIDEMVRDLRTAFGRMIVANTWMAVDTKETAQNKLKSMEAKIGYPDTLMDDDKVNSEYDKIPTDKLKYLETMVAYKKFKTRRNFETVSTPTARDEWLTIIPASVHRGYNQLENDITFPAGFLQSPVFNPDNPSSINYGSVGMLFGNDVTHAVDKNGSEYDAQGMKRRWWDDSDLEGYDSQTTCFVEQYGCYKWEGNSINGEMTLGENIADNGGLKMGYQAYRAKIKREGVEEQRLPGLDLDHNQIFFLSFAQTWCAKIREGERETIVKDGPHAPHPFRVLGALQNTKEFAEVFKCPVGTRMNPMRKCRMW